MLQKVAVMCPRGDADRGDYDLGIVTGRDFVPGGYEPGDCDWRDFNRGDFDRTDYVWHSLQNGIGI